MYSVNPHSFSYYMNWKIFKNKRNEPTITINHEVIRNSKMGCLKLLAAKIKASIQLIMEIHANGTTPLII